MRCGRPTPRSSTSAGHPAASVPCGLSRQGLPIGLQIAAGHYKDALVLRAAARYAETNPIKFPVLPEIK
jgi:aspartyl-tRNA(Asn)/glutamyl-tRNA(Gln) amidotransferase subunit A